MAVGSVSATDSKGNPVTYRITAGNDGGAFAISGAGAITVAGALGAIGSAVAGRSSTGSG